MVMTLHLLGDSTGIGRLIILRPFFKGSGKGMKLTTIDGSREAHDCRTIDPARAMGTDRNWADAIHYLRWEEELGKKYETQHAV